jgi:valyl-tRNA synthetase
LRLLAPFLPFVTEEVWSWWRSGSVHRAPWPSLAEVAIDEGEVRLLSVVGDALSQVRKAKSEAKVSMRTDVASAIVRGPDDALDLLALGADDLKSAGRILDLALERGTTGGGGVTVDVTL